MYEISEKFDFYVDMELHHYVYDSKIKKLVRTTALVKKVYDNYIVLLYYNWKRRQFAQLTVKKSHILSSKTISRKGKYYLWSIYMNDDTAKRKFYDYFVKKAFDSKEAYLDNRKLLTDYETSIFKPNVPLPKLV